MLCLFSFGITNFWGADIIRGDTVDKKVGNLQFHFFQIHKKKNDQLFAVSTIGNGEFIDNF